MAVKSVKAIEDLQTENMLLRGKLGHLEAKVFDYSFYTYLLSLKMN